MFRKATIADVAREAGGSEATVSVVLNGRSSVSYKTCLDIPLASQIDPPLTTVHQPIAEIGRTACSLLCQLINGNEPLQGKVLFKVKLL
jgi:DNA-binding LacI/PurR family transcriptional regulator